MGDIAEEQADLLANSGYGIYLSASQLLEGDMKDGIATIKSAFDYVPAVSGLWVPSTQRAVITPQVGNTLNLSVHKVPVRLPSPTETLVKIFYTGLCRSDACFSVGPEPGFPEYNHIAGHEGIGQVVKSHEPSLLGRMVGIRYLGATCGSCTYCLGGLPTSCPAQLNAPKQVPGTFQEYATVPTSCLVLLPDRILDEAPDPAGLCAALCSGSAALTALKAAHIAVGSVVVVTGVGGAIGHLAGAMARRVFGARVIGIDLRWKCDILREKGHKQYADILLDAPPDSIGQEWTDFEEGLVQACTRLRADKATLRAADAVVVCASSESAFQNLDKYVCDGGHIVCVGVPRNLVVSISIHALVERNLHLTGNLMSGHNTSLEVMRYMSTGLIQPMTTEVTLKDIPGQMQSLVDCQSIGKIVARIRGTSHVATTSIEGCLGHD